jgi:hypothetical protein
MPAVGDRRGNRARSEDLCATPAVIGARAEQLGELVPFADEVRSGSGRFVAGRNGSKQELLAAGDRFALRSPSARRP